MTGFLSDHLDVDPSPIVFDMHAEDGSIGKCLKKDSDLPGFRLPTEKTGFGILNAMVYCISDEVDERGQNTLVGMSTNARRVFFDRDFDIL